VALDEETSGVTADGLLSVVNDHAPLRLTYRDGSATTLTVNASGTTDYACLGVDSGALGGIGTLSRAAMLTLTSADGRVNCQLGTDVSALPADTWAPVYRKSAAAVHSIGA
jgi:hypothetical protein